jgi:NAD(P)-dependent dehydrogenase (short-subunit alcohol dehydrogenase family)
MSEQPVIMVTGGGRGIGAATVKLAAARGYAVCVNYLHGREPAEDVVHYITARNGQAIAIHADISSEADVVSLFQQVDSRLGGLSALVNNAATLEHQMRLDSMEAARIERTFAVNVVGSMVCAREAVKRMSTRHGGAGGAIVNVSSGAAKYGSPGEYVDYAASKGAIETFTIGLAREVAEEGIRVNAVRPGFIYTDLHAKGGEPGRVERVKALVPMQRGGQPEEVANAILWLLSGGSLLCDRHHRRRVRRQVGLSVSSRRDGFQRRRRPQRRLVEGQKYSSISRIQM